MALGNGPCKLWDGVTFDVIGIEQLYKGPNHDLDHEAESLSGTSNQPMTGSMARWSPINHYPHLYTNLNLE